MRIPSVTYKTSILDEMKAFYSGTLKLPLTNRTQDSFTVQIGDTRVMFEEADIQTPYYHFAIRIQSGHLRSAKQWLESRTTLATHDTGHQVIDFPKINSRSIYFFDPEQNLLKFIVRKDLDGHGEGEFTAQDIQAVAEVGLPVTDLQHAVTTVSEQLSQEPIVQGDGPLVPVGDYEGAFILVKEHEKWFMTDNPTLVRPINVKVSCENGSNFTIEDHPYQISVKERS